MRRNMAASAIRSGERMSDRYLEYTPDGGEAVRIGYAPPYYLIGADGLHGVTNDLFTKTIYRMDGSVYQDGRVDEREIMLRVMIARPVAANRIALIKAFNPKTPGTLKLVRGSLVRTLRCYVENGPQFPDDGAVNADIRLVAPTPYWSDDGEVTHELAVWEGVFEWPLEIVEGEFVFGRRTESRNINVINTGDVETGMRIVFRALGDISNPALIHVRSYEKIRINADLHIGDVVTVSTVRGEKYIEFQAAGALVAVNAFDMLEPESKLDMQLAVGENLLRYEADAGEELLAAYVHYTTKYLGV